jgi:hypothetical protein
MFVGATEPGGCQVVDEGTVAEWLPIWPWVSPLLLDTCMRGQSGVTALLPRDYAKAMTILQLTNSMTRTLNAVV